MFVHVIVSPTWTVTVAGENLKLTTVTPGSPAAWARAEFPAWRTAAEVRARCTAATASRLAMGRGGDAAVVVVAVLVVVLVEMVVVVDAVVVVVLVVGAGARAELDPCAGLATGAAACALWAPSVPSGTDTAVAAITARVGAEGRLISIWLLMTCAGA